MVNGFTERELAALPAEWASVIRMRAEGRSPAEIKKATGVFFYRQSLIEQAARRELQDEGLETLERWRAEAQERDRFYAELSVLPNTTRNCLLRNGIRSAADIRTTTDADLLKLRNFGVANLRYVRQHFPYEGAP